MMILSPNQAIRMASKPRKWRGTVKGMLKAELKRRDISYSELAEKLRSVGVEESERNIANKISRGTFTAIFFVQCLKAIGCRSIHLDDA